MAKNFLDKDGVSRLIYNFKSLFATLSHKHEISDLTDYTVDSALSSTSTNPIQNKVVNEGFSLVANSLTSMQNSIKGKADKEHEHTNYALTSYVDETFAKKSDVQDVDLSNYETKEDASAKLDEAKQYTDTKTSGLASTSTVDTKISTHNTSTSAHSDIRDLITGLTNRLNALADSDDTTLDQMSEIVEYIKSNKSLIDSITTSKVSVSDIVDNLTTSNASKVLSAKQGIALKGLIDTLQTAVNGKAAQTSLDSHTGNTTVHITSTERTNWNAAKTHADSAHAPSNAQANVIESIKVNGTAQTISEKTVNITVPTKASDIGAATASHNHAISEITNLQTTLNNTDSAISANTNSISTLTDRTSALEGKVGDGFEEITSAEISALFA